MANVIQYAEIFQTNLDALMVAEATTGWMELNASQVQYNGGKTINIPDVVFGKLAKYDRENGFKKSAVTLNWTQYTMSQDRGTTFSIDAMDIDESGFVLQAGNLMAEYQRTIVVPEVDGYRYGKLASSAETANVVKGGLTKANLASITEAQADALYSKFTNAIAQIEDIAPAGAQVVITTTPLVKNALTRSKAFQLAKNTTIITKGDVDYQVDAILSNPIVEARSNTFFKSFAPDDNGGDPVKGVELAGLITLSNVPIAVSKTEKIRIFTPDVNQQADAYKLDYRKYHELWVLKNKKEAIQVITLEA